MNIVQILSKYSMHSTNTKQHRRPLIAKYIRISLLALVAFSALAPLKADPAIPMCDPCPKVK